MSTSQEELIAATIRHQIAYLEGLLSELQNDHIKDKTILLKTRDVEAKLRDLRSHLIFQ